MIVIDCFDIKNKDINDPYYGSISIMHSTIASKVN